MKTLVILGSARGDGNTEKAVQSLCPFPDYKLIRLQDHKIQFYCYDHGSNQGDDFFKIAEKMGAAEQIVFATPVYWYAMSGVMKIFFDRLTELLSTHKQLGKSLKGKRTYLIATGTDPELPPGFEVPFRLTSDYFEMKYEGARYQAVR